MTQWRNWSRAVSASPKQFTRPRTDAELEDIVTEATDRGDTIRVAGSGHSFSPVVPSDDTLISLERYTGITDLNTDAEQVRVRAGTTLADLNQTLAEHDLAMSNLGDIDRQTVAGALTTGTHGTGLDYGVLAEQIASIQLLTPEGEFVEFEPGDDEFPAAQVSLGALGIITEVTLDVEPAYDLCLRRHSVPIEDVLENPDQFHGEHRNWEFFWFPHTDQALVKTFDMVPREANGARKSNDGVVGEFLDTMGARAENSAWEAVCQLGMRFPRTAAAGSRITARTLSDKTEIGPSHEVYANPRNVRFKESEYGLPVDDLPDAVRQIRAYIESESVSVQFPIECRFVGGDDPYLSPAHGRDTGFIAVHTYYQKSLSSYFDACEAIFDQYDGRPHWGKQHSKTAQELADLYPHWEDFQTVRREYDPDGIFLNDHLERVLIEA